MRRFPFVLLLAVLAFLPGAPWLSAQTPPGTRWALLVGVEEYENPGVSRLEFAVKDVRAIGQALQASAGFPAANLRVMTSDVKEPDSRLRPLHTRVLKALDLFADEVGPNDTFLFYFSGHGFSREGRNFLGTVNTDPTDIETLALTSVPLPALQRKIAKLKARQVIFIVDACRNDPEKGKGERDNKLTAGLAKSLIVAVKPKVGIRRGSAVLFACRQGERAFEDPAAGQSVFTRYLLDALGGRGVPPSGDLSMNDIARYVQKQVTQWAKERGKQQTPDLKTDGAAKIVLAPAEARGATPVPATVKVAASQGVVRVRSVPAGALVFVEGKTAGQRTPADVTVELGVLKDKHVEVGLQLADHHAEVRLVTVTRGATSPVEVRLRAKLVEPSTPPGERKAGTESQNARDGAPMVWVPAGEFPMGSESSDPSGGGRPVHRVRISKGFWLYKHEVTEGQYRRFCTDTGRALPEPAGRGWNAPDPMGNVTWWDAEAYCRWAGGRLPTEAEWEYAARGPQGNEYPWGDAAPSARLAVYDSGNVTRPRPANSLPEGKSWCGALHLAGNLWEWCNDWYRADYYQTSPMADPPGPTHGNERILRGGSWQGQPWTLHGSFRFRRAPSYRLRYHGFRAVVAE